MSLSCENSKDSTQNTSPIFLVEKYKKYWNQPNTSRGNAILILQYKPSGTFLVRKSREDTKEGLFLLVSLKQKVHTVKIHFDKQNGFKLFDCTRHFLDVDSLIAHHCFHAECNCCTLVKLTLKTFSAMNPDSFRDNHLHNDIRINNEDDTMQSKPNDHGVKYGYSFEGIAFENVPKDEVESNTMRINEDNMGDYDMNECPANISNQNIINSTSKKYFIYDYIPDHRPKNKAENRSVNKYDAYRCELASLDLKCKKRTDVFHNSFKDATESTTKHHKHKRLFIYDIDLKNDQANYLPSSNNETLYKNMSENSQNYNQIDVAFTLENAPFRKETSLKDYNNNYFNRSLGSCGFDKTSNLYNTINHSYDIRNKNINKNNPSASSSISLQNNCISDHNHHHYDNLRPCNIRGASQADGHCFHKKISKSEDYGINKNLHVFNDNVRNDINKTRDENFNDYDNVLKVYKLPIKEPVVNTKNLHSNHDDYHNIHNTNNESSKNTNKSNNKKSFSKRERLNTSPKSSSSSPGDSLKESRSDDSPIYKQPYTQEDEQALQRYKSKLVIMRSASFYKASQKLTVPTHYNIPVDVTPSPKFNPPSSDAQHFFPEDFRYPFHHTSSTNSQSLDVPSTISESAQNSKAPSITDLFNTCRQISNTSSEVPIKPTKTAVFYSQSTVPSNNTNKFYDRHTDVLKLSHCLQPKTFQDAGLKNTGVDFAYKGCDNYVIENTCKSNKMRKSSMPYLKSVPFVDDNNKNFFNTEVYMNEKIKRKSSLSDQLYDDALTIENPNAIKPTKLKKSFKKNLPNNRKLIEVSEIFPQDNSPPLLPPRLSAIPPPIPPRLAPQLTTNRHFISNCHKQQVCIQSHLTHHNPQTSHNKSPNYFNCFIKNVAPNCNTASIKCLNDNYLNFKAQRTLNNKNNYNDNHNADILSTNNTPIDEYKLKFNDFNDQKTEDPNESKDEINTDTNTLAFIEYDKGIQKSKSVKIKLEKLIRGIKKKNFNMKNNRNTLSIDTNNNTIVRQETANFKNPDTSELEVVRIFENTMKKDGVQAPQCEPLYDKHRTLIRSLSERDNIGGALVEEFVRATKASHMQDAVSMTVHIRQFMDGLANYVRNEGFWDEIKTLNKRDKDRHIEEILTDLIIKPLYKMLCQSFGHYRHQSLDTLQQLRISDDSAINGLVQLIRDKVDMSGWMNQGVNIKLQQLSASLDLLVNEMLRKGIIAKHQIIIGTVTCVSMALLHSGTEACIQAELLVALINKQMCGLEDDLHVPDNDSKLNKKQTEDNNEKIVCDNNDNNVDSDNCFYSLFILSSALHTMYNVWSFGCRFAESSDNILRRNHASRCNTETNFQADNNENNSATPTTDINDKYTCEENSYNKEANKSDNNSINKINNNNAMDSTKVHTKGLDFLMDKLTDASVKVQFSLGEVIVPFNTKTNVLDIKRAVKHARGVSKCVQCCLSHSFEPKTVLEDAVLIHTLIPNKGSRLSAPVGLKSSIINGFKKLKTTRSVKKQSITAALSIIPSPMLFVLEMQS